MKVALVVDNPTRDLSGLVLLAIRLCQEDVICHLVSVSHLSKELWSLAPDFVLLNYLRPNNQELVRKILNAGIKVGILDTEGGVLTSLDAYAQTMAQDPSVRRRISLFCTWGKELSEYARQRDWFQDGQIVVTGSPRYDFYAKQWHKAALHASRYCEGYSGPMVLINGNFPVVNPRFQTPEQEAKQLVEQFGYDPEYVRNWQKTQQQTMVCTAELANHLADRFPHVTFVFRPHPFERLETYDDLLEVRSNLHLVNVGTVDGWILRARAVIQRSCSTAIEAGLIGVPAFSPAWVPTARDMPTAQAVSIDCPTEESLINSLDSVLAGNFEPPTDIQHRLDNVIKDWFHRIDGLAHERVATRILKIVSTGNSSHRLRKCRDIAYGLNDTSLKRRARAALSIALGLPVGWSFKKWAPGVSDVSTWETSGKYFDANQVNALTDAIYSGMKSKDNERIRKVRVTPAHRRGDYHFGYSHGRSITIYPDK